ncbi:formylglycine-generating enzyme family protein [Lacihabitans sp. LS3-19]|uniref:formylglycine-generating enzyme family protein n=1 Tax=Lacihabitans sp. LS3-19 TaxID=2487335 RepID=UPI0020CD7FF1|nr:SUMF1/EgtB/PvdO family nonheme iron enzyme [Lacihabitans sp. LS3-19]MCP9767669.1 formylglycine-generating enzyme family protein [Lacihabitans sp. LS3-19]
MWKISALCLLFASVFVQDEFKTYTQKIPNSNEAIEMIAIEGGKFKIGSPETEALRKNDEGPQKEINISPFWMSKFETTWDTYLLFQNKELELEKSLNVDAIARPTKPYVEMSFGQGKNGGFPVCNVTQYAARAYCKWLYQTTGIFYRLPTEAEWEYAARAGTQSAFYFGDNVDALGDFAWYYENSDGAYKKVGLKKPNAWGLYDMLGNVSEWTSDYYDENYYQKIQESDPINIKNELYPHTIKGGHWDDDPDMLRSAARQPSTPRLKQRDPQIPRSKWWMTDAPFLGFRIVRPMKIPSKEQIDLYFSIPPSDN